jgi:hypothetical protein
VSVVVSNSTKTNSAGNKQTIIDTTFYPRERNLSFACKKVTCDTYKNIANFTPQFLSQFLSILPWTDNISSINLKAELS